MADHRGKALLRRFLGASTLRETIGSHDNNYTLVRLLLAASVIHFHSFALSGAQGYTDPFSRWMWPTTDVGGLAVKLFFFLSGLFVAQSFHRDPDLFAFMVRRFLRIWPALFVCLLVTALLLILLTVQGNALRYLRYEGFYDYVLRNSAFHLTWEIDGVLSGLRRQAINGPIHTLPMEAKMYAVLACVGALGLVRSHARIVVAAVAALALAVFLPADGQLVRKLFDADWSKAAGLLFLAGMLAYGVSPWLRPAPWQGLLLVPAAIASSGVLHDVLFYASAAWIVLMVGQSRWIGRLWRPREDLSYGIYLYGWPCQQAVLALTSPVLNPWWLTVLATVLAAAFAWLSWRIVEKPVMAFGKGVSWKGLWQGLPVGRPRRVVLALSALLALCLGMRWILFRWDFAPVVPLAARIVDFGPHESQAGKTINRQPDGSSAIWLKLEGDPGHGAVLVMDGWRLDCQCGPGLATARVPSVILARAGEKKISLEHRLPDRIERSNVVSMRIVP